MVDHTFGSHTLDHTFWIIIYDRIIQIQLKQKGFRAYFALKKQLSLGSIQKEAVFKLFDALVMPIISYSFQTWGPSTEILKILASDTNNSIEEINKIYLDPMESLHLSFLKWTIGVSKRCSNTAVWGDCGRYPLGVTLIKQLLNFYNRLNMDNTPNEKTSIARHALAEQKLLSLQWYKSVKSLIDKLDPALEGMHNHLPNATFCLIKAKEKFDQAWDKSRSENKKLGFYNSLKQTIKLEPYLKLCKHQESKLIAKLRMSDLMINGETGRHGSKAESIHHKSCNYCTDLNNVELLAALPFCESPIIEDELHIMRTCMKYHSERAGLPDNIKTLLYANINELFNDEYILQTATYVRKLYYNRFPKRKQN